MTKQDMIDLLVGKAVRYLQAKNTEYKFYPLVGEIELIVERNIHYESYDMGTMQDELYDYCDKLVKGVE